MLRVCSRSYDRDAGTAGEEELVSAALAGEAEFAGIYALYLPRVYRYVYARVGTAEDAADLTQVVFLKAYNGLASFRPGKTPFAAWLFRIARNAAVDHQRRKRPMLPLAAAGALPDPAPTPESFVVDTERARQLRSLISQLDAGKRDLLSLRYGAGLSVAEIAAVAGKREAAIKKQLTRTLHALKEKYRDEPGWR